MRVELHRAVKVDLLADCAHGEVSPHPCRRDSTEAFGKCRWNYITGKVAGSNPAIAGGNPSGVAQLREHSLQMFHHTLVAGPKDRLGECRRNYIAPNRDHPRVQLPSSEDAQTENHFCGNGGGAPPVSSLLSPGPEHLWQMPVELQCRGFEPRP